MLNAMIYVSRPQTTKYNSYSSGPSDNLTNSVLELLVGLKQKCSSRSGYFETTKFNSNCINLLIEFVNNVSYFKSNKLLKNLKGPSDVFVTQIFQKTIRCFCF